MIEVLISGKLLGKPEQRTAKSGRLFVTARMRVAAGAEEAHFVRLSAFSETASTALLALGDGDALAVAGTLKVSVWTPQGGDARPNLDMVAAQVLTAYHLERRRKAMQPGEDERQRPASRAEPASTSARRQAGSKPSAGMVDEFGDAADDEWLKGGAR